MRASTVHATYEELAEDELLLLLLDEELLLLLLDETLLELLGVDEELD